MTRDDLRPGVRLQGRDLSHLDWTDLDLSDAVLTGCTLSDVQLSGVVLEGARLADCRLVRCRFAHADLRDASFEGCSLADDQGHAGVVFAFSRMDGAAFSRCDLSFSRLERSSAYGLSWQGCNLRGATFTGADFSRAFGRKVVRWDGRLIDCNLELADLADLAMPGCELTGSNLREAVLTGANLEGADLTGCDLFQALTAGARLAGADLRGAEVSGLDVSALGSHAGLRITADQAVRLLLALGLEVEGG